MKKIFNLALSAFVLAVMVSMTACGPGKGQFTDGMYINDQEDVNRAVDMAKDIFVETDDIVQVKFNQMDGKGTTKKMESLDFYCYEGEGEEDSLKLVRIYLVQGSDMISDYEGAYKYGYKGMTRDKSVKFTDIDFSKVTEYTNEAGKMLVEMGTEEGVSALYSGVTYYKMDFDGDGKNPLTTIAIQSKDTVKSTSTMSWYSEYIFTVKDGVVEFKE